MADESHVISEWLATLEHAGEVGEHLLDRLRVTPTTYDGGTVQVTESWTILSRADLQYLDAQAESATPTTNAEGVELVCVERAVLKRLIRQAALVVP